jgi:hypothetical protein
LPAHPNEPPHEPPLRANLSQHILIYEVSMKALRRFAISGGVAEGFRFTGSWVDDVLDSKVDEKSG